MSLEMLALAANARRRSRLLQGRAPFRANIIVENAIMLEIKPVSVILPAHEAQLQTYFRMSRIRIGLIMNFAAVCLKDGLRRFVV